VQPHGIDFHESFSAVARLDTIRLLLGVEAHQGWQVFQLDIKSAFLNGYLVEKNYVEILKVLEEPETMYIF